LQILLELNCKPWIRRAACGQEFLREHGLNVPVETAKTFGMNWKMTAKTILVQLHHKLETFEHLGKHLVLVI
jgi:hypothetical protein